jgi:DNA-binding MarR family transcriptional regulator
VSVVEQDKDRAHGRVVLDFLMFLSDTLSRTSHDFESKTACSPEEATLIRIVTEHGALKVKDIAQALPGMDPSKLTRVLDGLEQNAYVTRRVNPEDRRSFLITPTANGIKLLERFTQELDSLAQAMLAPLTQTERLILVELFHKIRHNWKENAVDQDG